MIIDITRNVQEAPLYPGTPPIEIERLHDVNKGDAYSVSKFVVLSHVGTHADAESHFMPGTNRKNIEQMTLDHYYGSAHVVSVPRNALVTKKDLEGRLEGVERLVIHGGGKSYLARDAADYIVAQKIQTVIIDAWSVAPLDNEKEIHQTLLGAGIAIVENVILDNVDDGAYTVAAFPLKIKGSDGAPVRAVLIK
jgi:arylformamidase